jgi:hypothetical protein
MLGVCLALLLIGGFLLMGWLFNTFHSESQRLSTAASRATTRPLPPQPRLQASPTQDLLEMRQKEEGLLRGYAWVDRSVEIVSIPIEDAIAFVAQQGLPDWHQAPNPQQDSPHPGSAGGQVPQSEHQPQRTEKGK